MSVDDAAIAVDAGRASQSPAQPSGQRSGLDVLKTAWGGVKCLGGEARRLLTPDIFSGLVVLAMGVLFVLVISRHSANPLLVASFFDDEALISLQLDGMTKWPYGNPATYLGVDGVAKELPELWRGFNYQNIPYYGGLYLDLALVFWAPAKAMGADILPGGLIILRALSLLFTLCMLLAVYNFAKAHLGRIAAAVGMVFLATDYNLLAIGTVAHPDSLMFFLTIVALAVAVRHARDGDAKSLIAFGLAAGLVQGAKMGGPLLVPMTVIAIGWGARDVWMRSGVLRWLLSCILRGSLAVVIALAVFVFTTPFAVLDGYFLHTWLVWAKQFTGTSPIQETTFWDWLIRVWSNLGPVIVVAAPIGLFAALWRGKTMNERMPVILAAVLGVWIFLYYALLQKYWVQLQYLAITYWIGAALAAVILDKLAEVAPKAAKPFALPALSVVAAMLFAIISIDRLAAAAGVPAAYLSWSRTPQYVLGKWTTENLSASNGKSILYDFPLYVDPKAFSSVSTNGGPIRYADIARQLPDYVILTRYAFNWQTEKILAEEQPKWNEDFANVRLYQEVMAKTGQPVVVNTERAPFLKYLYGVEGRMDARAAVKNWNCLKADINLFQKYLCLPEIVQYQSLDPRFVGLFEVDKAAFLKQVPTDRLSLSAKASASSTVDGSPDNILGVWGNVWRSDSQGPTAIGQTIGLGYPVATAFSRLRIKWVAWHWCPTTFEVETSDDGAQWTSVGSFTVKQPPDPAMLTATGTMRWEETFDLPPAGAHKHWRMRVTSIKETNFFGLEQLRFE